MNVLQRLSRRLHTRHDDAAAWPLIKAWRSEDGPLDAVWRGGRVSLDAMLEVQALIPTVRGQVDRADLVWLRNWLRHNRGRRPAPPVAQTFEPFPEEDAMGY